MAKTPENRGSLGESGRRGGRRRTGRLVETTVVLDREDLAMLDEVAANEGRSRSELIREAIRRTWITGPHPTQLAARPAAPGDSVDSQSAEAQAAWQARFGILLTELQESAVTDMTDEELTAFVREEIQARRQEKRKAQERHAGSR